MKSIGSQSFDQKLKTIVFRQWEKIVLSFAVLGIFGFFWFGRVKPYDKSTPDKLLQSVRTANSHIQNPESWNLIADSRRAADQTVEMIDIDKDKPVEPFPITRLLGTKFATRGLREDPDIKGIVESRAQVVVGSLFIKRPRDPVTNVLVRDFWNDLIDLRYKILNNSDLQQTPNDDEVIGIGRAKRSLGPKPKDGEKEEILILPDVMRSEFAGISPANLGLNNDEHSAMVVSVVAVTALFQHELQAKEYEKFKDSVKYNEKRDQPYYVYLQVERRKRIDGKESEWEDITSRVTEYLSNSIYAAKTPEIVEDPFVDPYLTVGIPPLIGLNYKTFCSTEKTPSIVETEIVVPEFLTTKTPNPITIDKFKEGKQEAQPEKEMNLIAIPKFKLIRFFDLNVGATEVVQYRFRVWLADPNNPRRDVYARVWNKNKGAEPVGARNADDEGLGSGAGEVRGRGQAGGNADASDQGGDDVAYNLADSDLANGVRKRIKDQLGQPDFPEELSFLKYCRPSEWSEPTEWTTVSQATGKVVTGRIETGIQQNSNGIVYIDEEPQVDVVIKKWDLALQVEVPIFRKVHRGDVMNFRSPAKVVNPVNLEIFPLKRELIEEGTVENGVKFATDAFVIDMIGGKKMPFSTAEKTYYEPSEILVMRADGSLVVRNELGDHTEFRHGIFAEDELLSDFQTQSKPDKKIDEEGSRNSGRRGR